MSVHNLDPIKILLLFFVFAVINANAQIDNSNVPEHYFYINTVFNKAKTNNKIYQEYFDDSKNELLCLFLSDEIKRRINQLKNDLGITKINVIVLDKNSTNLYVSDKNNFLIKNEIYVDGFVSMHNRLQIFSISDSEIDNKLLDIQYEELLKEDLLKNNDQWSNLKQESPAEGSLSWELQEIANILWERVENDIKQWIIDSNIRFRVSVNSFTNICENDSLQLEELLQTMIETEFVRSDAIFLHASDTKPDEPTTPKAHDNILLNYLIEGNYCILNDKLRIDIKCIKKKYNIVLATRKAIIDTIDIENISREMTKISGQLKRTMEADFNNTVKTIAVVGINWEEQNSDKGTNKEDKSFTNEIVRVTTQKLRMLTQESQTFMDSFKNEILKMKVINISESLTSYNSTDTPSEILYDLDADYLLLMQYQDLGEKVRLSTDLHSYDTERPGIAIYVNEEEIDKVLINEAIDNTINNLVAVLRQRNFLNSSMSKDSISIINNAIVERTKDVHVNNILLKRQVGFRFGAVLAHNDPELFLGRSSGNYFEFFYSAMLPFLQMKKNGGRWDTGYEVVLGIDKSFNTTRISPIYTNTFINMKTMFTTWQYSNTSFNVNGGVGIGVQRITYDYVTGDVGYTGEGNYLESAFSLAFNIYAAAEFPIWRNFMFDLMLRYIPPSRKITTFEKAPIENSDGTTGLTGKLGGIYLTGGIKYKFY